MDVGVSYVFSKYIMNYGVSVIDFMIVVRVCDNKFIDFCLFMMFCSEIMYLFIFVLVYIMECDFSNYSVFIMYSKFFDGCKYCFFSFICKVIVSRLCEVFFDGFIIVF